MDRVEQIYGKLDYEAQGAEFLHRTKTELKVEFLKHGRHFEEDKEDRDIYKITLTRGERSFSLNFGQSIKCSGVWTAYRHIKGAERIHSTSKNISLFNEDALKTVNKLNKTGRESKRVFARESNIGKNPDFAKPSAYDVLTCLTKSDPGSFEDFCGDFGYDEDSRKAEKTYKAVREEFLNIERLFSCNEIEELQYIQ